MTSGTILAFDIGLKRTGVASGQHLTKTAQPAGQLRVTNGHFDWGELDYLIDQWQPASIVIGNPNTDNPHLNKVINRFKSHIEQRHKIPLIEVSEELTSVAANAELQGNHLSLKSKIELRDQIAACLILESYFNTSV